MDCRRTMRPNGRANIAGYSPQIDGAVRLVERERGAATLQADEHAFSHTASRTRTQVRGAGALLVCVAIGGTVALMTLRSSRGRACASEGSNRRNDVACVHRLALTLVAPRAERPASPAQARLETACVAKIE